MRSDVGIERARPSSPLAFRLVPHFLVAPLFTFILRVLV